MFQRQILNLAKFNCTLQEKNRQVNFNARQYSGLYGTHTYSIT